MKRLLCAALASGSFAASAPAAFHVMQIEEVIGGINGNTAAQAIQLRMAGAGQNQVQQASVWVWDASGNRTLLLNIGASVPNSASGARVLLATATFTSTMVAGGAAAFTPDFTMAAPIPAAALPAGRITFESDGGTVATPSTIWWSFAWGGYGLSNTGSTQNDVDGNFGPAFASALPTSSFQGVIYTGGTKSTNNAADYVFSANPAAVTKNNGTAFTVVPEPGSAGLFGAGALFLGGFAMMRRRR